MMSFLGRDVTLNIYSPSFETPLISSRTARVAQDRVEFANNAEFDITDPNDDFRVVNTDVNVSRNTISYRIDDTAGRFTSSGEFNGFVITDAEGNVPDILGVTVASDDFGIPSSHISFTENGIFVNFAGLSYARGDRLVLNVEFREPRPTPSRIIGTDADDVLTGSAVSNRISGRAGSDILDGGAGNDTLLGDEGSDVLTGGLGVDHMRGGADADRFDFNALQESKRGSYDFISDFVQGVDKIDLQTIDANSQVARNQAFHVVGDDGFTGHAGELSYRYFNESGTRLDRTLIALDVNGDRIAEMRISVKGLITFTSDDFIL